MSRRIALQSLITAVPDEMSIDEGYLSVVITPLIAEHHVFEPETRRSLLRGLGSRLEVSLAFSLLHLCLRIQMSREKVFSLMILI